MDWRGAILTSLHLHQGKRLSIRPRPYVPPRQSVLKGRALQCRMFISHITGPKPPRIIIDATPATPTTDRSPSLPEGADLGYVADDGLIGNQNNARQNCPAVSRFERRCPLGQERLESRLADWLARRYRQDILLAVSIALCPLSLGHEVA